jgi:fructose-1-phosphate kinase PfkB-like protein
MGRAIRAGARWAVVTAGADVSWITDGARSWTIRPPSVEVVNPIGSGDSFAAGLACGLARGQDVAEACRLGTACAAANAMTRDAGHVDPADVARLHRAIVLEPV